MAHGQGSLTQDPRTGNWRARYWGPDGKQRSKNFGPNQKTKARAFLAEQTAAKAKGNWIDPSASQTPFDDWANEWFAGKHRLSEAARARDGILLRRHVIPAFQNTPLGKISALDVKAWINGLVAQGYSAHTIRPCHRIFRAIMRAAIEAKLIADAPIGRGIAELPPITRKRERFLTRAQIEHLASIIDPHYRVLVYTAAYTGCRWQELAGLKREYLDLDSGVLHVRGVLKRTERGGVVYEENPKTDASRRSLALPQRLVDLLRTHLESRNSVWVFTGPQGGVLQPGTFRRNWNKAVKDASLEPLHFHDLRHTHAALLIEEGVVPLAIQRRLGHKDITTTMNTYGHLFPTHELALVQSLDKGWEEAATESNVVALTR